MCSHSSMSARIFSHKLSSHTGKQKQSYSHYMSLLYVNMNLKYCNLNMCTIPSKPHPKSGGSEIVSYSVLQFHGQELFYLPLFDSCSSIAATRAILGAPFLHCLWRSHSATVEVTLLGVCCATTYATSYRLSLALSAI